MNESQRRLAVRIYMIVTILSVVALFGLIIAHIYVRWSVNQNFSFLPGFTLESLIALVLGELLGFVYLLRGEK